MDLAGVTNGSKHGAPLAPLACAAGTSDERASRLPGTVRRLGAAPWALSVLSSVGRRGCRNALAPWTWRDVGGLHPAANHHRQPVGKAALLPRCRRTQVPLGLQREAQRQGLRLGGCHLDLPAVRNAGCGLFVSVPHTPWSSTRAVAGVTGIALRDAERTWRCATREACHFQAHGALENALPELPSPGLSTPPPGAWRKPLFSTVWAKTPKRHLTRAHRTQSWGAEPSLLRHVGAACIEPQANQ